MSLETRLPRPLASALTWPLFIFGMLLFYWSVAFVSVTGHLKWLRFSGPRSDILAWCQGLKAFFRFKVLKVGKRNVYRGPGNCVFLCNHRSWADFMVDQYVTEGRSLFMGRWAVAAAFPTFILSMKMIDSVILFKRGSIANKERFNTWIDGQMAGSPQHALSVYPEGHRSTRAESLPLKRGMLHYTFARKLPCQIVIGANKEAILSEKRHVARRNQVVAVGCSDVIHPEQYPTFDAFMDKVQEAWDAQWAEVFSADWTALEELPEPQPSCHYTKAQAWKMVISVLLNWVALFLVVRTSLSFWRWAFSLLGPLQHYAMAALAVYVAASFFVYSRPVNALELAEARKRRVASEADVMAAAGEADLTAEALNEATAQPPISPRASADKKAD